MKKLVIPYMPHVPHVDDYTQPTKWYLEKRPVEEYNPGEDDVETAFNPAPYLLALECEGRRWDDFLHNLDNETIVHTAMGLVENRSSDLRAELLEGGRKEINESG